MSELKITQEKVTAAFSEANDCPKAISILTALFGKQKPDYTDYHNIKTYEDACEAIGVTPFIMRCKCGGDMMHTKSSKQAPPSYVKVYNWVRPNLEQTMSLSEGMRNHILNGGLILEDELK